MKKAKGRISRFHGPIARNPGILVDGKSLDYDAGKIEKALSYNDDLSNQFIINVTPRNDSSENKFATRSSNELVTGTRRIKRAKRRKKQCQPLKIDFSNNPDVENLNTIFGEVEDFDLLTEVVPKERYVLNAVSSPEGIRPKVKVNSFWEDTHPVVECSVPNEGMEIKQEEEKATCSLNALVEEASQSSYNVLKSVLSPEVHSFWEDTHPSVECSVPNEGMEIKQEEGKATCSLNALIEEASHSSFDVLKAVSSPKEIRPEVHSFREDTHPSVEGPTSKEGIESKQEEEKETCSLNSLIEQTSRSSFEDEICQQLRALLGLCEQQVVVDWSEFLQKTCSFEDCVKLGEGAYGEVFKANVNDATVAMKVIPFAVEIKQCQKMVNCDYLNPPKVTYNELLITRELSKLADETRSPLEGFITPTFVRLVHNTIVKGEYPAELLEAWDIFKKQKSELAENQRPDEYADKNQHFIIISLSDGGKDLESYKIRNNRESFSIFYQMALSLAIAEEALEFEHRDLHVGNILIDQCSEKAKICYLFDSESIEICSCGVRVSIIDFSLSRLKKRDAIVYVDLSKDETLFQQSGDYQFEVYRMMRNENNNNWSTFTPRTNLFWLHYLSDKLFGITRLFREKRRKELKKLFDKLLNVERVRDFLGDEHFLNVFDEFRCK